MNRPILLRSNECRDRQKDLGGLNWEIHKYLEENGKDTGLKLVNISRIERGVFSI